MFEKNEFLSLVNDTKNITDDYLSQFQDAPILEDIIEYNLLVLSNIYEKKYVKKNIYPEILKQIICMNHKDIYGYIYNNFIKVDRSEKVNQLKSIPLIEQRSDEWFKLKEDSIGASEAASIFSKSIFSSYNKLLLKKTGFSENNTHNIACIHGTKYEVIAQKIYENLFKLKLIEFGSIKHPSLEYISASPDGITSDGTMIEIKIPIKRHITGIPPIYYWIQMQQQLQVCGLDNVDFVECKISEYTNVDNFENDNKGYTLDGTNMSFKSWIIEYHDMSLDKIDWYYPDTFLDKVSLENWSKEQIKIIKNSENKLFSRIIYYEVESISITKIWRDDQWWNANVDKYNDFWKEVEKYRKIGNESLITKKPKMLVKCQIDSDEE